MASDNDKRELAEPAGVHQLDAKALSAYLKDHIPGFGDDCTIQQFLGGQSNPTFLIEAASGSYVMRKKPPGELLPSAHAVDREYRVQKRGMDCGKDGYPLCGGKKSRCPGHSFVCFSLVVCLASVAFPTADGQQEIQP